MWPVGFIREMGAVDQFVEAVHSWTSTYPATALNALLHRLEPGAVILGTR